MKKHNPLEDHVLDTYEQEIEDSLTNAEWQPAPSQNELKSAVSIAVQKKKRELSKKITVRINQQDLLKLKEKAHKKNIPYQTLLGVLIRDFVEGDYEVKL